MGLVKKMAGWQHCAYIGWLLWEKRSSIAPTFLCLVAWSIERQSQCRAILSLHGCKNISQIRNASCTVKTNLQIQKLSWENKTDNVHFNQEKSFWTIFYFICLGFFLIYCGLFWETNFLISSSPPTWSDGHHKRDFLIPDVFHFLQ